MKKIKIILIILISVIALSVLGGVILYKTVLEKKVQDTITIIDEVINDDEFFKELAPYIEVGQGETEEDIIFSKPEKEPIQEAEGGTKTPTKPQTEYKNTYEYIKDNVETEDFKTGVSFASRIDVRYILGLLKGGLTSKEKTELKAYLMEHFTSDEISRGISIYNKYSHLLK